MAEEDRDKECDDYIVVWLFDAVICTTLSSMICIILSLLSRRADGKRPALIVPMDITDSRLRNRWSIAIAFATMLSTTSGLFLQQKFFFIRRGDENLSNVYSLLNLIMTVCTYFVVYYPYLACLLSEHHLVASILGFGYVAFRYIVITLNTFGCWDYLTNSVEDFKYLKVIVELPVIVFNAFLFIRFAYMTIFYTWKKFRRPREKVKKP